RLGGQDVGADAGAHRWTSIESHTGPRDGWGAFIDRISEWLVARAIRSRHGVARKGKYPVGVEGVPDGAESVEVSLWQDVGSIGLSLPK
ncbi:MAG: hypothetical protein QOJ95_2449, partial [Mycobacterium sp.]|nr:hypothetical protein [Mycobacterium sp.]